MYTNLHCQHNHRWYSSYTIDVYVSFLTRVTLVVSNLPPQLGYFWWEIVSRGNGDSNDGLHDEGLLVVQRNYLRISINFMYAVYCSAVIRVNERHAAHQLCTPTVSLILHRTHGIPRSHNGYEVGT